MLEIKFVRKNLSKVEQSLSSRGEKTKLDELISHDEKRKTILLEIEDLRHQRNVVSEKIAGMKKNNENAETLVTETREVSTRIKILDKSLVEVEENIQRILIRLPNIPHESVPVGKDESENPELYTIGDPPVFDDKPEPHWVLGENLKILDFERASRITGARFPLYFGAGARLERALINFMLDIHTRDHGYTEVLPPFIVNRQTMTHTGQLPKFEQDLFKLEGLDYYLIPTAEVPVTNIHQGEILDEKDLPILYTAYTPCFRSEAGSYGKDTRGLIRQHQFNKVELVKFVLPETSYNALESLLKNAEKSW